MDNYGAIPTFRNIDIPLRKIVAMDSMPFDWVVGYDSGSLVTKNQYSSGSCGGQMVSYAGEVKTGVPKSAKFPYDHVHAPGGGSTEGSLMNFITTFGLCDEKTISSYKADKTCDEPYMTDGKSNTSTALTEALKTKFGKPIYVKRDLESIAQAVRDHGFCFIGIAGKNNGTWQSAYPKCPDEPLLPNGNFNPDLWYHWLVVKKCGTINIKKYATVKNSWGDMGINGEQNLDATHEPYIFSAWTTEDYQPEIFKHTFNLNLRAGDKNDEVKALQDALRIDGTFPKDQISTGYFGIITLQAVKAFQVKYKIPNTGFCGPLTRAELNSLFS